jgi:homoserine O-succinyltransferase/O-acetyltransferase
MSTISQTHPSPPLDVSDRPVEIALVNTMPDAAFEETERQFTRLLRAGANGQPLDITLYSIPDRTRSRVVHQVLADRYQGLGELYRRAPDAVVVTGSEPRQLDLRDEAIWVSLSGLIRWARRSSSSVLLSCLTAHAALLATDGVERERLGAKHSGVYPQWVHPSHWLTEGVGPVSFPHSRLHDVPASVVEDQGYTVLLQSDQVGWTVAASDRECLVVLLQGHPEYAATTLLREYRRDVRRYLTGHLRHYPEVPVGYLSVEGTRLLESFRQAALVGERDATRLEDFPFQACADQIAVDWQAPMERLAGNWFTEVRQRCALNIERRTA